jgi:hypothetical protein
MWYIAAVFILLVEPTSWQCQQYLDTLQNGQSSVPEVIETEVGTLQNGSSSVPEVNETEVLLLWQLLFKWDITYSTYGEAS